MWPECTLRRFRTKNEELCIECLPCGYILGFMDFMEMRKHVGREHPWTIPTCRKCGFADADERLVAHHERVHCGVAEPRMRYRAERRPFGDYDYARSKKRSSRPLENLDLDMINIEQAVGGVEKTADDQTCIVCQDAEPDTCLLPCGHANYCFQCANHLKEGRAKGGPKCPECRKEITMVWYQVYPVYKYSITCHNVTRSMK